MKGSWMLHTIRRIYGEEVFWRTTQRLLYGTTTPWDTPDAMRAVYRSTDDFTALLSEEAGEDLSWLVDAYLKRDELPILEAETGSGKLVLRWKMPPETPFELPVPVVVNGERQLVPMPGGQGELALEEGATARVDPELDVLRRLPIIGDCAEQTDKREKYLRDRRRLMAIEYGWDNAEE